MVAEIAHEQCFIRIVQIAMRVGLDTGVWTTRTLFAWVGRCIAEAVAFGSTVAAIHILNRVSLLEGVRQVEIVSHLMGNGGATNTTTILVQKQAAAIRRRAGESCKTAKARQFTGNVNVHHIRLVVGAKGTIA